MWYHRGYLATESELHPRVAFLAEGEASERNTPHTAGEVRFLPEERWLSDVPTAPRCSKGTRRCHLVENLCKEMRGA